MREILFRAKAKSVEYGYAWHFGFLSKCYVTHDDFRFCIVYWSEKYKGFMNAIVSQEDENSIGQFTGLCDKNGTKQPRTLGG